MLYLFRLLFLLINIDQETVLNWFGIEDPTNVKAYQAIANGYDLNSSNIEPSTNISIDTLGLLVEGLLNKLQDGLTIVDIENTLFFILFVRFIILALRYNLKTSLYITSIGLFAGYLWYRHLIDIISTYSNVLIKIPFLQNLGKDAIRLQSLSHQTVATNLKLGENTHWYNPGQVIYYAIMKAIINVDLETGQKYYIDPISMIISKIQGSGDSNIVSFYYKLYNKVIPRVYDFCSKFWAQLSGVAAYAVITRIGKKYCPYLIRWHWTFLLIIMMVENIFISFMGRANYFQTQILIPQKESYGNYINSSLQLQINFLNIIIIFIVLVHIGLLIFGLFHAIWGQYFYVPFFVENTELHIGPRPKNSIYSGGNTSWQDPEEKEKHLNRVFPKLWYGWFGSGTKNGWELTSKFKQFINKIIKKIKR
uniref:Uncharacterized protein n=1 Tax=Navicula arenaria TaxID=355634 RepID=A0A976YH89_9STRA|nr:hypothetical protein N4M20_pgp064 [Navicula arenaria]UVG41585.1 hypothetical protein [Navicula arenaria]